MLIRGNVSNYERVFLDSSGQWFETTNLTTGGIWKAEWCKIQETKLASRPTNILSRSREISTKLNKIKSPSTSFHSRSRYFLIKLNKINSPSTNLLSRPRKAKVNN